MSVYQNKRNGQLVELVSFHDKDYALVKNQSGNATYVALSDLEAYEAGKGRTGEQPVAPRRKEEEDPDKLPATVLPSDTRLNLNTASAEMIAQRIKGVGYSTAKKIVELRMGLPGEKFVNLDQVRSVGRVDWEQVIKDDLIFVA